MEVVSGELLMVIDSGCSGGCQNFMLGIGDIDDVC